MFRFVSFLLLAISFLANCSFYTDASMFQKSRKYTNKSDILEYLKDFGYFDDLEIDASRLSLRDLSDSIKDLQESLGLSKTGLLDTKTLRIVNSPRCSNKETIQKHHHSSEFQKLYLRNESQMFQKYTLYGTKWDKSIVTYQITRYSRQRIGKDFIDRQIQAAFYSWERHIPLRFVPGGNEAEEPEIEIQFTYGNHGDNYPFPPGSSQLAHAFYPPGTGLSGDIHFNDEVDWTQENMLFYTALHEIGKKSMDPYFYHSSGHTLGLRHSSDQNAIMYSHLIQDVKNGIGLDADDISGAQRLYGTNSHSTDAPVTTTVATTTVKYTTKPVTNLLQNHPICRDGRFDAMAETSNGRMTFFRGNELITVKIDGQFLEVIELQRIRTVFNNRIPVSIDAAFTLNQKTYLFKGKLYWRTTGFVVDEGYPKLISRNFNGIPENIDAAFVVGNSRVVHFVKGSNFWEYELSKKTSEIHEIRTHWNGIPYDRIEAAYSTSNGTTFFFREGRYWKLQLSSHSFVSAPDSQYPRDVRVWWLQCSNFYTSFEKL